MMKSEVLVCTMAEILGLAATTSFNRRKIFEQREVVATLSGYMERHLSFDVRKKLLHDTV